MNRINRKSSLCLWGLLMRTPIYPEGISLVAFVTKFNADGSRFNPFKSAYVKDIFPDLDGEFLSREMLRMHGIHNRFQQLRLPPLFCISVI
jgi:hypothetical protein